MPRPNAQNIITYMLHQLASPNLSPGLQVCILWQRMKEISFKMLIKMEWEVLPEGGHSHALPLRTLCRLQQEAHPSWHFSTGRYLLYYTSRKCREIFYLPSNRPSHWETVMNQPVENHYASILGFLQWTFCLLTAPPNSFLFLYKVIYLSSVISRTCLWFAIAWVSQI